jgi:two-component system cell cycle sensor histidine kinase/response regulator CckA
VSRPSDRELYQLFERSPIGMYRSTKDGRFVYANPALVRLLGYDSVDELLAVNLNDHIYVDPAARQVLIERYRITGVVDGAQVAWKHRAGRELLVRIYGHVIEGDGGASFDASVLDVTETEATNAKLRAQHRELESTATILDMVVRQMPALYWLVDPDLRIIRTGGAIESVLGYAPDLFIGKTLNEVHNDEPGSVDPVASHARAVHGQTTSYTTQYRSKHLETIVGPYRVDGKIVGAIGTCIDVTASRALERRMVDAQRAESLGVLAGGLAHDFNNLLVAILGNADLGLRDTPPGTPGRAALDNIRHTSLRAAELTDQLLAYAGRGGVAATRVQPAPVIEELLRISAVTMPENAKVTVEVPAELAILGDAAQLRQVLLNLIGNARDALGTRGGAIAIAGRAVVHDGSADADDVLTAAPGAYVQLDISDDGPGMTRDTRRRIFEPFFTTKPTGHGLGLAAVLGIVRAHGGGLRLVTSPGQGTSFQVLWPAAEAPPVHDVVAVPGRTVLVIDDEDMVREVVARMIEDLGYAAVTAADGIAGLEVLDRQIIDAVLVDLSMPRMGGADVVAALRQRRPDLPVVLCTGYDRDRRGPIAADAYLPKPFRIEALEQTLAKLLR